MQNRLTPKPVPNTPESPHTFRYHPTGFYEATVLSLQKPGIVIYLKGSTWTLSNRIRKRDRSYERDIDREYLAQLNIGYENGSEKSPKVGCDVTDTDNYDYRS